MNNIKVCGQCGKKKRKRFFLFGGYSCINKECSQYPENIALRKKALDEMIRLNQEMGLYDDGEKSNS
ncbi:MAG: hypothetical protein Q8Q33_10245 [Chlamydiota bacterium]|nr:hypothetical protein [Chlamydiota bacterium]